MDTEEQAVFEYAVTTKPDDFKLHMTAEEILQLALTKIAISRCRASWREGYIVPEAKNFFEFLLDEYFEEVVPWGNMSTADMDHLGFGKVEVNNLVTLRTIPIYLETSFAERAGMPGQMAISTRPYNKGERIWPTFEDHKNERGETRSTNFNAYRPHYGRGQSGRYLSLGILPDK